MSHSFPSSEATPTGLSPAVTTTGCDQVNPLSLLVIESTTRLVEGEPPIPVSHVSLLMSP